jgi:hypothetical protein
LKVVFSPHWLGNSTQVLSRGDDGWSASGDIPKLVHYGPAMSPVTVCRRRPDPNRLQALSANRQKSLDTSAIPLCTKHHRTGADSYHRLGPRKFSELFPGCPPTEALTIAAHTTARGSGRVGRTAAGKALDERAITAAAIGPIRHTHTGYDELLMSGFDRLDARDAVRETVDRVFDSWPKPG